MRRIARASGRLALRAVALATVVGLLSVPSALALGAGEGHEGHPPKMGHGWCARHRCDFGCGTLGYGPPGLHPGFQGFGLGYHLGYGYGGYGLGVGCFGGYPDYGGPGYPHCEPPLQRFGRIAPFTYYGGPPHPRPGNSNYYEAVGPLIVDAPVARVSDRPELGSGYPSDFGPYTGKLPYPETFFAPYASAAAATGSSTGEGPAGRP